MNAQSIITISGIHFSYRWDLNGEVDVQNGIHAYIAAKVRFIPNVGTSQFTLNHSDDIGISARVIESQRRLLINLAQLHKLGGTNIAVELRYVTRPANSFGGLSTVDIFYVFKAFAANRDKATDLVTKIWVVFSAAFPQGSPAFYPLDRLSELDLRALLHGSLPNVESPQNFIEIRKFDDYIPLNANQAYGYYPHPFKPTIDDSAMALFIESLAALRQDCIVSICLQPTVLLEAEQWAIAQMQKYYTKKSTSPPKLAPHVRQARQERVEDLNRAYDFLLANGKQLFQFKIQVASALTPATGVVAALGSLMCLNAEDRPRQWSELQAQTMDELDISKHNLAYLEFQQWGHSLNGSQLARVAQLVTIEEALGAFRLPVEYGVKHASGLDVRQEPFNRSFSHRVDDAPSIMLGAILDEGQPTDEQFLVQVDTLKGHTLIVGATSAGKTNTARNVAVQAWANHRIPFLILDPLPKRDYRGFMGDNRLSGELLIFKVGDTKVSPFVFNPFAIVPGINVRTHISRLLNCFNAAFTLWDPLPTIYREALVKVYIDHGWRLDQSKEEQVDLKPPTMADFYDAIVLVAQTTISNYSKDIRGTIYQGSEVRIRGLLENIGHVINATDPAPIDRILRNPTIMELASIGSPSDIALVMSFVLLLVTEQLESRLNVSSDAGEPAALHMTIIEEAHILMPSATSTSPGHSNPQGQGAQAFNSYLAETRGYGEMVVILEQIPTDLVSSAVGNTAVKIMHRLEDPSSFELMSRHLGLSADQQRRARALAQGEALVRDVRGNPVHILAPLYSPSPAMSSDHALSQFMAGRIVMPLVAEWTLPSMTATSVAGKKHVHGPTCRAHPETCSLTGKLTFITADHSHQDAADIVRAALREDWSKIITICHARVANHHLDNESLAAYCYLAVFYRHARQVSKSKADDHRTNTLYVLLGKALQNFYAY